MAVTMVRHSAALAFLFLAFGVVTGVAGSKYRGQNEVKRGQAFNVTCTVAINEGVIWTKDGHNLTAALGPFSVDERKINESVEATLTVQNAKSEHSGSYQCSKLHKSEKHLVRISQDAQLTAVYDSEDVRFIDLGKTTFALTCNIDASVPSTAVVNWLKEDEPVGNTTLKGRYHITKTDTSAVLTIKPVNEDDYGNYTCRLADQPTVAARFRVFGAPHVRLPPNHNVVEGQKVKIVCTVHGKPYPQIHWTYSNGTTNETIAPQPDGRISLAKNEAGVDNAMLVLTDAVPGDYGFYYCIASQRVGNKTHVDGTTLRVKDKYAALWPFIGICAEVVVLCAIILVYEKRRTKNAEMDDSDTDNHDQKKS